MHSRRAVVTVGLVLCVGGAAHADRGALAVDAGAGVALINVRAPYATGAPSQIGSSWTTSLGLRYAVTNMLEVGAAIFYQPPTNFTHGNATVEAPAAGGALPGTLSERTQQLGVLLRARVVKGYAWRVFAAADVGWAQRFFSKVDHFNVSDPSTGPRSYGLALADTSQSALVLAPSAGVEWTGDRFSIGIAPRVDVLLGSVRTWAVSFPLTISWAWYL
jgi:hypothetical protein